MTLMLDVQGQLTTDELEQVKSFAEFLIARRSAKPVVASPATRGDSTIHFEGWAGSLAHIDPNKSDNEVIREAWDAVVKKYDK